jgi:hypothetical protein
MKLRHDCHTGIFVESKMSTADTLLTKSFMSMRSLGGAK